MAQNREREQFTHNKDSNWHKTEACPEQFTQNRKRIVHKDHLAPNREKIVGTEQLSRNRDREKFTQNRKQNS